MNTLIIIGMILFLVIIIICLYKYSVNGTEWYSSYNYPTEAGQYLTQDYDSKKYQIATFDDGWYFQGVKPKHFRWRKLDC